ncbi:Rhodanese-related sulfurtransferase [Granulicella rosea]|uniref:Rhodanese-related sulfurtransferase n=1 Tax=Granulicella rosea TaxID=474952 RepID=A0A239K5N8_9BACT|nr:hypothetical protein [Granulicella rosea]SNT13058.1 Rhodanese-related sulfurtransferase [Granulicella rosea]
MLKKIVVISAVSLMPSIAFAQQPVAPAPAKQWATAQEQEPASKAKKLTREEFDSLVAHPDEVQLIDIRTPEEIAANGGFPSYLNIQLADLKGRIGEVSKDRLIITISSSTARAGVAADLLAANGLMVAGAIGAQSYVAEGGTLQKKATVNASNAGKRTSQTASIASSK